MPAKRGSADSGMIPCKDNLGPQMPKTKEEIHVVVGVPHNSDVGGDCAALAGADAARAGCFLKAAQIWWLTFRVFVATRWSDAAQHVVYGRILVSRKI